MDTEEWVIEASGNQGESAGACTDFHAIPDDTKQRTVLAARALNVSYRRRKDINSLQFAARAMPAGKTSLNQIFQIGKSEYTAIT